ncbi:MAG TPA: bifunctional 4-hydroxy-2-oxoglutarate aldolase/2-dehydro-3-deoxy-phosphogluconate aldolase [Candidatus Angelobacter sp.]|nr:bifunctional 4-hydroxy-2-oxoglutarate aldolase/2-dehydro-3-deoxy-phosphogluconate aldolase [Candidatus Angelobacter sp.]
MNKEEVRARIEEIGIVPAIRVSSVEEARFAAAAVSSGGIPIVEITMTVPEACELIEDMVTHAPDMIVGAGTVLDPETARRCLKAGAHFLTSPGLDLSIVELTHKANIVTMPGALTPSEVTAALRAGVDFIKVFPCAQVGGAAYIRALKGPFPHASLIAAGGVTQQTASDMIRAGATALGIGGELIPREAVRRQRTEQIVELAKRFLGIVREARKLAPPAVELAARF